MTFSIVIPPSLVVEVRMPVYRRPQLLRRALESLLAQTHPHWVALVFDDCPDQTSRPIVEQLNDPRIRYQPNTSRMGAGGNIDQCFHEHPMADGHYACILEDDNTFPETFEQNIQTLRTHGAPAIFRARQRVIIGEDGDASPVEGHRGLAEWLQEGSISHRKLAALHLIVPGLGDTTLFWQLSFSSQIRLVAQADSPLLDVGGHRQHAGMLALPSLR
jgi:hypothetical protein